MRVPLSPWLTRNQKDHHHAWVFKFSIPQKTNRPKKDVTHVRLQGDSLGRAPGQKCANVCVSALHRMSCKLFGGLGGGAGIGLWGCWGYHLQAQFLEEGFPKSITAESLGRTPWRNTLHAFLAAAKPKISILDYSLVILRVVL